MKVILASQNQHKLVELSAILSQLGFEIALESEYGLHVDVDETGTTFEENSLLKAEAVMKASGMPVLADDSCAPARGSTASPTIRVSKSRRWTARRACTPPATAIKAPTRSALPICLKI